MQFDFSHLLKYYIKNKHAKWRSTPSRFFCNRRIHPCSYVYFMYVADGIYSSSYFFSKLNLLWIGKLTSVIHFEFRLFIMRASFYLCWKVNVSNIKQTCVNVIVDCLFTAHEFINVMNVHLMYRLTVFYKR